MSEVKRFDHSLNYAGSDDPESCMVQNGGGQYCLYAEYALLEKRLEQMDAALRSTVPERWKSCTSPVGSVQGYIGELEQFKAQIKGIDDLKSMVSRILDKTYDISNRVGA